MSDSLLDDGYNRRMARLGRAAALALFTLAGCKSTVAATYPHSAAYAEQNVAGRHQSDLHTVLASPDDPASRAALACILAFAHGVRVRDARIEAAKMTTPRPNWNDDLRPPPMPGRAAVDEPQTYCRTAAASADPRIAAIGKRYAEAAETELGKAAVDEAVGKVVLDDVDTLIAEGEMNLAYRKLYGVLVSGPPPVVMQRASDIAREHRVAFAKEEAFERLPETRLLRKQEKSLDDAVRRAVRNGGVPGRAGEDLRDVRDLLAQRHDEFVATH